MRVRATRTAALGTGPGRTLAQQVRSVLASLRSAGVPITNQLLADQWAYQQRALALYPGQPAKCVLFQDAAGTTPVTAVEQPIGLALDLETAGTWDGVTAISSLPGTHMLQSTTSKRAMLSARVSFLNNSAFTGGGATPSSWIRPTGTGVSEPISTLPGGSVVYRHSGVIGDRPFFQEGASRSVLAGQVERVRVLVLASSGDGLTVTQIIAATGTALKTTTNYINGSLVGGNTIVTSGNIVEVFMAVTASGTHSWRIGAGCSGPMGSNFSLDFAEPDARLSVDVHPSIPAYQRVTTATDYDTVGFPVKRKFDGVDDAYASAASLNLTGTDEVTVFAPVLKESDAATGVVLEASTASSSINPGTFALFGPVTPGLGNYGFRSVGSLTATIEIGSQAAPRKSLLTGIGKISTDTAIIRVNGVQAATSAVDQGTGNYGNHTLFEGARNQASVYFKGETQGFLILGKNLTASQLAIVEKYINNLWKAY